MRRAQHGWRTAASWQSVSEPSNDPVPQLAAPEPGRLSAAKIWEYMVAVRSRLGSVGWSVALIGVLGYLFAATTYRLPIGTASMIVGIFGLFLLPGGLRFPSSATLFLLFLAWASIGAIFSPWNSVVFDALLELGKVFLIYLVIVNAVRTRSQIWFFMVAFLALYGSHPVRGAIVAYMTGNTYFGRAAWYQGIYSNPNDLAALTLLQLSMAAALLMTERKGLVKLGALLAVFLLPFTILVTQSRGVMIALAVFVAAAVWGHPKKFKILGTIGLLAALAVVVAPAGLWNRIEGLRYATNTSTLNEVDEEGSAAQRWEIWRTGARIARQYPVMGTGLGAYRYANGTASAALGNRDAHSTYLTLWAENGVIGLGLFLIIIGATIARAESVRRRAAPITPAGAVQLRFVEWGLIAFLIAAIWGSYSKLSFLYVHLALIWALADACDTEVAEARRLASPAPMRRG